MLAIGFFLLWASYLQENSTIVNERSLSSNRVDSIPNSSNGTEKRPSTVSSPRNNNVQSKSEEYSAIAFSDEKMEELYSEGYKIYKDAEREQSSAGFFKAGTSYDHSYKAFWGDNVFGGVNYQSFLNNIGLSGIAGEEGAKKIIQVAQESLVVSCECYAKALSIDPNHYESNLRLATALTVALQVDAALPYWRKLVQANSSQTAQALIVDSMGFAHRSIAAKEVIYRLGFGGFPQSFSSSYLEQQAIASTMLRSSPYLMKTIL